MPTDVITRIHALARRANTATGVQFANRDGDIDEIDEDDDDDNDYYPNDEDNDNTSDNKHFAYVDNANTTGVIDDYMNEENETEYIEDNQENASEEMKNMKPSMEMNVVSTVTSMIRAKANHKQCLFLLTVSASAYTTKQVLAESASSSSSSLLLGILLGGGLPCGASFVLCPCSLSPLNVYSRSMTGATYCKS
jgi:hypothetical protein